MRALEHVSTIFVLVALVLLSYYQLDSQARIQALEQLQLPPVPALLHQAHFP